MTRPARWRWPARGQAVVAGLVLVAAYALLQTLAVAEPLLLGWTALAAVGTLISPLFGLIVLAALGPFTEALTADGRITAAPFLLAALGASVLARLIAAAATRRLQAPPAPILAAAVLFTGTLVAVAVTGVRFGLPSATEAFQLWVPGIGGGLTVLVGAWWVARDGERWPLLVVVTAVTLAALLSVVDYLGRGAVQATPLGWLLRTEAIALDRLGGIIPAPNAAAAIFLAALSVAGAAALAGRPALTRWLGVAATAILLVAVALTLSRSALLALVVLAVLLAARARGWAGVAVVGGGLALLALAIAFLPGVDFVRDVPRAADDARLEAWAASVAMFLDQPLTGHGFRSFEWLHDQYGTVLDVPHNEWLRFFAEGGVIVGLAGITLALLAAATLIRAPGWLAGGLAGATCALLVMALFNNPFIYVQVNVPTFLIVGTGLGLVGTRIGESTRRLPAADAAAQDDVQPAEGEAGIDHQHGQREGGEG